MKNKIHYILMVLLLLIQREGIQADEFKVLDFSSQVQPIFQQNCIRCHGPEKHKGGLRLDSREQVFLGGDSGKPAVIPYQPESSRLIDLLTTGDQDLRMPPKSDPLNAHDIDLLERWIKTGAIWPDSANVVISDHEKNRGLQITDSDRNHWSFRALEPVHPPSVSANHKVQTPVDLFILSKLENERLTLSPPADPSKLIRRLYFDLIGLPPTPVELNHWLKQLKQGKSQRKFSALIDHLLSSPHYGERWGRHWLDLARYADSAGYERDADQPNAHAYRDFVIRALNQDLPFNKFVQWQIAGDELAPDNPDALAATGFCTLGPVPTYAPTETELNKRKVRYDVLDDQVSTTASAMLGLTVGCARCHDHKYDPIPMEDYYRMTAVFLPSESVEGSLSKPHRDLDLWVQRSQKKYRDQLIDALTDATEDEKKWLKDPPNAPAESKSAYRKFGKRVELQESQWLQWLGEERRNRLTDLRQIVLKAERQNQENQAHAIVLSEFTSNPPPAYLYGRGDVGNPLRKIDFGFLQILSGDRTPESYRHSAKNHQRSSIQSTFQRAALAEWMTDVKQGAGALLARVAMNRLWQHHFGAGLARTPNDVGFQGEEPTHPLLLDYLAQRFIEGGWRMKPMHRLILQSAVYQQSSQTGDHPFHVDHPDPNNRLFWRREPSRLEAEVLRDAVLAVSGNLDRTLFGPPIRIPIPESAMATRSRDKYPVVEPSPKQWRRSIYLFVKRSVRTPMMEIFDAPDPSASCGARMPTTVPTQALTLMNDPFIRSQAGYFASRILNLADRDSASRIRSAFQWALARQPTPHELNQMTQFLNGYELEEEGWLDLCHTLFTLNEFAYVD